MAKFLVRQLVQSGLRGQLGCEGVVVVVNWGDDDGANWTIEFVGLPAPRRCMEAAEAIVNELRAKYRLAKDRLSHEELTTLLLNQVRAEIDLRSPPVPPTASAQDSTASVWRRLELERLVEPPPAAS